MNSQSMPEIAMHLSSPQPPSPSSPFSDGQYKRKFEDAMQSLDEAVGPSSFFEASPPPTKKVRTTRSLYATLAKYGIKKDSNPKPTTEQPNKFDSLSKTAPHLAAILSRTASRTRKVLPFRHKPQSEPTIPANPNSEYRPSSTHSFLTRLATYKLTTYANKPPAIDAVAAAKCGWINDGKDRLVCGICDVSWVIAGKEGMSRDAANALVEKQRVQLVDQHKSGCPWKTKQCDASIYRVPLQTPAVMIREVKARADKLESVLENVQIKHPLTSSQVQSLVSMVHSAKPLDFAFTFEAPSSPPRLPPIPLEFTEHTDLSETAILVSLFGWSLPPPPPPSENKRLTTLSRSSSLAPSTPRTPPRSRLRMMDASPNAMAVSPSPSPSRPPLLPRAETLPSSIETVVRSKPESTACLHCSLCQRRIGLWAFMPEAGQPSTAEGGKTRPTRQFDILKEHRSYCPYAVRSTVLPTPPLPQQAQTPARAPTNFFSLTSNPSLTNSHGEPGAVEGWRAVLTVVMRYGSAKRQRFGFPSMVSEVSNESTNGESADQSMEQDEVEAMVSGVKSHGGRDLLKYVKGLLG